MIPSTHRGLVELPHGKYMAWEEKLSEEERKIIKKLREERREYRKLLRDVKKFARKFKKPVFLVNRDIRKKAREREKLK